jgi:FemAB-related protein (PEP-CTERM system-associated)
MSIIVRPFRSTDTAQWDDFVRRHPFGTPFHLTAWKKTIEDTFSYEPQYLIATCGENVRGVLPLFFVQNFAVGKVLLSTPFAVYGGALTDSPETAAAISAEVRKLSEALRVGHTELRNAYPEQRIGYTEIATHLTFVGPIGPDEEQVQLSIPRKTRRIVRKSLEQGFETRIEKTNPEVFEQLYARNLRKLGTPAFPHRYFAALLRNFKSEVEIREVWMGSQAVAAVLTFYFRDQVLPYYGASDERYNAQAPATYMYYDLMRSAGKAGYTIFDFGRSKVESGSTHFKSHWGLQERPLPYEILLVQRKELPNFTPTNPLYQYPIRLWQKLPLPVTRTVGPYFIKLFP